VIIDLNTLEPGVPIRGDVCIVGCGAVGMAMARELMRHSVDTVLVDGGSQSDEPQTQALYDCEIVGLPFGGAMEGRFRVLGGSTTRWGGQALPMDPIDFERRDWVAHSGWPIEIAEVSSHYRRVAEYMQVDDGDYADALARKLGAVPPPVDTTILRYHFSKWAPRPSLREIYLEHFRRVQHLRLYTHANVTRIDLASNGAAVNSLTVRSFEGAAAKVEARYFVLAAGGIENARLLLANRHQVPAGVGNGHDLVGRFLQDHPTARAGAIQASNPQALQRAFNVFYLRGKKYAVRLSATESFQRTHQTLNLSSGISFEAPPDSGVAALKSAYRRLRGHGAQGSMLCELSAVARSTTSLARPVYEYLVNRRQYIPDASYAVHVICEQEPDPSSQITLTDTADALGMPKARIDWRLQPSAERSIRLFALALKREFDRLGFGPLSLVPWIEDPQSGGLAFIKEAYHHIGTTRMHHDPRRGVVDRSCKIHGIDNLYIAGTSVFPTGGHSNPTFTALALSFRTCDELRRRMLQ
jgi:choline dehydrogenase-like flavoprotein